MSAAKEGKPVININPAATIERIADLLEKILIELRKFRDQQAGA